MMLMPLIGYSYSLDCINYRNQPIVKINLANFINLYYASSEDVRIALSKLEYVSPLEGLYMKKIEGHKFGITKRKNSVTMYVNKDNKEFMRISNELEPFISGLFIDELGNTGFSYMFKNGKTEYMITITEEKSIELMKIYMTEVVSAEMR